MGFNWKPRGIEYVSDILARTTGEFVVYFDTDVDGVVAGREACSILDAYNKPYSVYINENRAHGFQYDEEQGSVEALRGKTVIAVDFNIAKEKLQLMKENNIRLINIDHHDINSDELVTYSFDGEHVDGVVINNQYSFEPEEHRYLSGAGVVFYVFANIFAGFDTPLMRGLVGLTLLSDIRPLENEHAKQFLHACYTSRDEYMQYLVNITKNQREYGFGVQLMERNFVDFTFSPKFNALFRLNKGYTAIDLMFGRPVDVDLVAMRDKQNEIKNLLRSKLQNPFITNGLLQNVDTSLITYTPETVTLNNEVQLVQSPELKTLKIMYSECFEVSQEFKMSNFVGLTCSAVAGSSLKSSIVYMGTDKYVERGSFRGRSDFIDYLKIMRKHGLNCEGHEIAFGIKKCDLTQVDFASIEAELGVLEREALAKEMQDRIIEVNNLGVFAGESAIKQIAMRNNYVRSQFRVYLRYTGSNITRKVVGKMIEYDIDGIKVKCFDETLTPKDAYIMPLYDRKILVYYLRSLNA